MCSNHDELNDDLSDIFGSNHSSLTAEDYTLIRKAHDNARHEPKQSNNLYWEDCKSCKGTGKFYSYTGRYVGPCFKCEGKGRKGFKTSPEQRQADAESRARVEARKQEELREKVAAWYAAHEEEVQWMIAAAGRGFGFASSLWEDLNKKGSLSDKQMAAMHKCMASDQAREEAKREIEARAPDIDAAALGRIMDAFKAAIAKDIKYPKMRLDTFLFSLVRSGQNAGAIYVKSIAKDEYGERQYHGKIVDGRFVKAFKCSEEDATRIVEAAADPEAAAIAYGRREGACSICGRKLTNHESIDRGIGPVCADNFGW